MGRVTTTLKVTNHIDKILAERGFISAEEVRFVILNDVLVDTGASQLCLPAEVISQLGVPFVEEIEAKTVIGTKIVRVFKEVTITIGEREGNFNCLELPEGEHPLIGWFPLEGLGLEPDLTNQRLRVLPNTGNQNYIRI